MTGTNRISDDALARFSVLRQSADEASARSIECLVRDGADRALNRVNVLDFARLHDLDEEKAIGAFLHASRLGIFDLFVEPALPRLRRRARGQRDAQDGAPDRIPLRALRGRVQADARRDGRSELHGQPARAADRRARSAFAFRVDSRSRSSGVPASTSRKSGSTRSSARSSSTRWNCPQAEYASCRCNCRAQFVIVFDPVTHATQFIDVQGEATRDRQDVAMVFNKVQAPSGTITLRPGPLRLALENRTGEHHTPRFSSPETRSTTSSGSARCSSPPSACSRTRCSATCTAPTRSTWTSVSASRVSPSSSPTSRAPPNSTSASATCRPTTW